ncbi:membrane protein [Virgisporangium aliadipatigenens]|uniref:Membrane protein n=1 Tax=Virgisporangium aliadipatigenens TaxID=741659 RepID=A0A8J3YHQ2_9ACTN|nr:zf-HC2 domain-containing protein [Virgisporangium aliadipatigenens]GIJ44497.1 membrane protein [Virgisporangium aliadipatigenens]
MGCERYREALSARLDGEPDGVEDVDAHLAGCAGCTEWFTRAGALAGLTARAAEPGPAPSVDLDAILDAVPPRRLPILGNVLRVALGLLGTAQVFLGMLQIANGGTIDPQVTGEHGATPGHLWHESAAWNVALGAGFVFVAVRRTRPTGLVPTLTAFVGVLALLSANDLLLGRVDVERLVTHGSILAGYLIVVALTRPVFNQGDPPSGRGTDRTRLRAILDGAEPVLPAPRPRLRVVPPQASARSDYREAA